MTSYFSALLQFGVCSPARWAWRIASSHDVHFNFCPSLQLHSNSSNVTSGHFLELKHNAFLPSQVSQMVECTCFPTFLCKDRSLEMMISSTMMFCVGQRRNSATNLATLLEQECTSCKLLDFLISSDFWKLPASLLNAEAYDEVNIFSKNY